MSNRPFTAKDHQIADTLSSYWANFAAAGNPGGNASARNASARNASAHKDLPPWPAVTPEVAQTMEVGEQFRPIPIAATPERIAFFRRILSGR